MADTVTLNPGVGGSVIATDDIDDVHFQRVKVNHGRDGEAADVSWQSPLPTADGELRRLAERQLLAAQDAELAGMRARASERISLSYGRGCR